MDIWQRPIAVWSPECAVSKTELLEVIEKDLAIATGPEIARINDKINKHESDFWYVDAKESRYSGSGYERRSYRDFFFASLIIQMVIYLCFGFFWFTGIWYRESKTWRHH